MFSSCSDELYVLNMLLFSHAVQWGRAGGDGSGSGSAGLIVIAKYCVCSRGSVVAPLLLGGGLWVG